MRHIDQQIIEKMDEKGIWRGQRNGEVVWLFTDTDEPVIVSLSSDQ